MSKMIFISLLIKDFVVLIVFYMVLGFEKNFVFSDDVGVCMVWSEVIYVMLVMYLKWCIFI